MSTNVGTLQGQRRLGSAFWPIVLALFAAAILTVYVATTDREAARQASTVSSTAANTPTELSGVPAGSIPDTAANTPTEMRGGFPVGFAAAPAGIVETGHAELDAATGDNPGGSPHRHKYPIGFHPLP